MFANLPPYVAHIIDGELAHLSNSSAGRNNALFKAAARLFSVSYAAGLDIDTVETELDAQGRALGLARSEIRSTLISANKRAQQHPAELPADVLERLTGAAPTADRPVQAPEPCAPPCEAWQAAAGSLVAWAADALWDRGHDAQLDYLNGRGLSDMTTANARLGYNPTARETSRAKWGLAPHDEYGDRLWLPRGIVLPWFVGSVLWKVQIRRDDTDDPAKRYYTVPGSANGLYGAARLRPHRPAMLVEGVFDALAVRQVAGDLITTVACGTTGARRAYWYSRLALAAPVLLSFDNEGPGAAAATYWQRILGAHTLRWLPTVKDPAAMLQSGLDVRAWVQAGLEAA